MEFRPTHLSVCQLLEGNIFIGEARPTFSWRTETEIPGFSQGAYRLQAASTREKLLSSTCDLWDSGLVASSDSLYIPWGVTALPSRQRVFWQVMVWNQDCTQCATSEPASFAVALLDNSDWQATWIYSRFYNPKCPSPCPFFRKEFSCEKVILSARLYVTARGIMEIWLNGNRVGNDCLAPGWTDFNRHIQYMTYDVTGLLDKSNAIGAILADGWCCGNLTSSRWRNFYSKRTELLLQLEIEYADASRELIVSGEGWKTTTGPILQADLYDGEYDDARLEMPGWSKLGFDESDWEEAKLGESPLQSPALAAKCCPGVRKIQELEPVAILHPQQDVTLFDFGQNITGWVKIRYRSHPGRLFSIRFAEMLNPDGTLYTLNYRSAHSTDYLITAGPLEEVKTWEPGFTFHGFRYAQIDGFQFSDAPDFIEATAVVIHSDLPKTGNFACGNDKVNQLYSNITWGQRDNFLEIPTDCPQRDERLGWTGDAQIFCTTAACNQNVSAFFRKWLRDQREAQLPDGSGALIVPNLFPEWKGEAGWADALVIVPWSMYLRYGDISFLQEAYDSMKAWILYQRDTATNLIRTKNSLGDWLALSKIETPKSLIGTAYFSYTTALMAKIAVLLGKKKDADYYAQLCSEIKLAFRREFLDESGLLTAHTQTACVLALHFDLLPGSSRTQNSDLLRYLIEQNGTKLDTGFLGTAYLMLALAENNLHETAYSLLLQEEYPSWLFSVNQGATTLWERWNSFTKESGFGEVLMNSFNHYAYGAVGEWMFKYVAGIDYDTPGGKSLLFRLVPDKRMDFARVSLQTPYGLASSGWQFHANGNLCWKIQVPPNTSARIEIPESFSREGIPSTVKSGKYRFVIRSQK